MRESLRNIHKSESVERSDLDLATYFADLARRPGLSLHFNPSQGHADGWADDNVLRDGNSGVSLESKLRNLGFVLRVRAPTDQEFHSDTSINSTHRNGLEADLPAERLPESMKYQAIHRVLIDGEGVAPSRANEAQWRPFVDFAQSVVNWMQDPRSSVTAEGLVERIRAERGRFFGGKYTDADHAAALRAQFKPPKAR
jgi:hypothetical protein